MRISDWSSDVCSSDLIAIPVTGWLADRVGSRNLFLFSVVLFVIASMLCGIATTLPEMVAFRLFQGVAGAFIVPLAQTVMLDINPPSAHGRAMAIYGMGVMIGPVLGPLPIGRGACWERRVAVSVESVGRRVI